MEGCRSQSTQAQNGLFRKLGACRWILPPLSEPGAFASLESEQHQPYSRPCGSRALHLPGTIGPHTGDWDTWLGPEEGPSRPDPGEARVLVTAA